MGETERAATMSGPQFGDLLPDFTAQTTDGRTIHRRDFKGRRHLVVCCADRFAPEAAGRSLATLAALYAGVRAERGEVLFVSPDGVAGEVTSVPMIADADGVVRGRFGAAGALLLIADRYGEVVLRVDGAASRDAADVGLPFERILPTLEWLEMCCSL